MFISGTTIFLTPAMAEAIAFSGTGQRLCSTSEETFRPRERASRIATAADLEMMP
jgi:hypothetical protein